MRAILVVATFWAVVPPTAYAQANRTPIPTFQGSLHTDRAEASLEAQHLAKRSDEALSSSAGLVDYIASAIGYGSSAQSTFDSIDTHTAANSSSSGLSLVPSHSYVNGSSTNRFTSSSAASAEPSLSTSVLPPSNSSDAAPYPVSSSAADQMTSTEASPEPTQSLSLSNTTTQAPESSPGPAYPASNSSSSQVVTAVYSRTHVSVINTGDYASQSSAWALTGASLHPSANASLHSSGFLPPSGSYTHNVGHGASNSTAPYPVAPSGFLPISGTGHEAGNGTASHSRGATGSAPLPGTGVYAGNATSSHGYGGTGHAPSVGTGYPYPNATISAPYASGTGIEGHHNHTNATTTVPRTGLGYSYAQACNKASVDWSSSWLLDQITSDTMVSFTGYTPGPNDVYTLCDEIPRMRVNLTTSFAPYTHWSVVPPATITGAPPQPNCTVVPSDCSQLLSSYSLAHYVPASVSLGRIHPYMSYIYDDWPRCTTNPIPSSKPGADCGIYGQGVQLLYWPQVYAEGRGKQKYCNALMGQTESVTLGPTIAGQPNTVVSGTHTFTSPTVYIKYSAMSAMDWGDIPVGPTLYDSYVALESTLVSTKLPYFWTDIPWEGPGGLMEIAQSTGIINAKMEHGYSGINLNFADEHVPLTYPDLASPVPALPYFQRRVKMAYYDDRCWMGGCPTMMPWDYGPVLAIPDTMRYMAPEWNSCTLPWGSMDDPPKALVTQTAIVMPTAPVADPVTTTPALPSPATAGPVQATGYRDGTSGGGGPARTSEQDTPAPQPTQYNDGEPNQTERQDPTSAKERTDAEQPAYDSDPTTATPVDNPPSRTSTAHDAAGVIASLLGNAGTQATTPQAGSTNDADANSNGGGGSNSDAGDDPADPSNNSQPTQGSSDLSPGSGGSPADGSNNGGPSQSSNQDSPATGGQTGHPAGGETGTPGTEAQPTGAEPSRDGDDDGGQAPTDNRPTEVTLGSDTVTARPAQGTGRGVVVGSQTLVPGAPATNIDGHTVSVGVDGGVQVDGTSAGQVNVDPEPTPAPDGTAHVTLAPGNVVTAQPAPDGSDEVVVGSQTLSAGGSGVVVDGHTVSVATDGNIQVDGTAAGQVNVAPNPTPAPDRAGAKVTLAPGNVVTAQRAPGGSEEVVVGSQTLSAGGSGAIIDGHSVSVRADGQLAVDGSFAGSVALQTPSTDRAPAPITLGTQILTAQRVAGSSGIFVVGDQTLREGGAVATLNGHIVSLGSHGKVHVDGSVAAAGANGAEATTVPLTGLTDSVASLTLGDETVFALETTLPDGRTAAVIDGQTITSGSAPSTIDGTIVSFGSDGLVVQTPEATIAFSASSALITAGPKVLTASKTILANGETAAVIGTRTLRLGGAAQTIEGEAFSLASNGLIQLDDATTADFRPSAGLITIDRHFLLARYTVLSNGQTQAIVGTETLTLGGPAETVDGTRVSLEQSGIVVGDVQSTALDPEQTDLVNAAGKAQATATDVGASNGGAAARAATLVLVLWSCVCAAVVLLQY